MSAGLSVIVPVNEHTVAKLAPLLDSLWTQTQPPDEVLVMADALQLHPATASFIAGARIVPLSLRFGSPACWNMGVEQSRNDWCLLVEPGCVLGPGVVAHAMSFVTQVDRWRGMWTLNDKAVIASRVFWQACGGFPITAVCHARPFSMLPISSDIASDVRAAE